MFDVSDEATGLSPLHQVTPEDSIFALEWVVGAEGLVITGQDEEPIPVQYISFRGIVQGDEGSEYGQIHVAIPTEGVPALMEQWGQVLADLDADTPPTSP